ncbi:hypothetical protein SUGI_0910620, partial [Cryptomeria japonica]
MVSLYTYTADHYIKTDMENKGSLHAILLNISSRMNSNLIVGSATVLLMAIIGFWFKKYRSDRHRLPPGPRALPVIGHFHLLIDKERPFHRILDSLSKVYGPIMHLKFGSRPVLIISSSELAKECFTVNDLAFASRPRLSQGKHLGYDFMFMGWAPYGSYWRNVRKICALELLSSKQIQTYRPKRMREISKTLNYLFQQAQMKTTVNMRTVLSQMTLNVLMSMIMGDHYFGEEAGMSFLEVAHLIEESFVLHGAVNIGDYIPWLKWLDLQGYERAMKKVQGKLNPYMQRIVEKHRENPPTEKEDMDFIDVLILQAEENGEAIPDKDTFIKSIAVLCAILHNYQLIANQLEQSTPMAPSDKGDSAQQLFLKSKPSKGFIKFNDNINNNNVNATT